MILNIGHSYMTTGKKLVVITKRIVLNTGQVVYSGVKPSLTALPSETILYSEDGTASTSSDDNLSGILFNPSLANLKNVEAPKYD